MHARWCGEKETHRKCEIQTLPWPHEAKKMERIGRICRSSIEIPFLCGEEFDLHHAVEAYKSSESRRARGKVVLSNVL